MPGIRRRYPARLGRVSLLFDQNLSRLLPALLVAEFPGSEQVFLAGLAAAEDMV